MPKELLFDNLKQVVASPRSSEASAVVQPAFQAFADHVGFAVVASPPYWPRAKSKVERAIGYIKQSFLERRLEGLDDLNRQFRVWLGEVANPRRHGTLGERPEDRLAVELSAPAPVRHPQHPGRELPTLRAPKKVGIAPSSWKSPKGGADRLD